jgi:hypothetical protein
MMNCSYSKRGNPLNKTETRKGRFYQTPDGEFPSVTTILSSIGKPALINWAAKTEREFVLEAAANLYEDAHDTPKMARPTFITTLLSRLGKEKAHTKEIAKASAIGSQVHALIEWTMRAKLLQKVGPAPSISPKGMWAFSVFEKWSSRVGLKPFLIEQTVYSSTYGYAGTMDLLAEIEGKLTVVDWKTGKAIYLEAHLQNAAYRHALREMGHGDAEQGIIVRLPKDEKDPEPQAVVAGTMPDGSIMPERELLDIFLGVKRTWEYTSRMDTYKPAEEEAVKV